MKPYYILIMLALFVGFSVSAQTRQQDSLIDYYNKFPETAIKKADSLYKIGVKKRDNVKILEALILKTTFTLKKDYDQYQQQIQYLEGIIRKEKDVAMRSLLHSYVGELYKQFYQNNSWEIDERTELADEVPEDMNTWSKKQFDNKIREHLKASVAPQKELQTTPIDIYDAILIRGTASDTLQPTLYDFLCHRFFCLFASRRPAPDDKQTCLPELYGSAETFAAYPLPDDCDPALKVCQQLLAFRLQQREIAPAALVWADLERIRRVNMLGLTSESEKLYIQRLKKMMQEYAEEPTVVEVVADYAIHLYNKSSIKKPQEKKEIYNHIYDICEKAIQKFNMSPRIGRLEKMVNRLKRRTANIQFPEEVYPGEDFAIRLFYKNVRQIKLEIIKLPNNILHEYYSGYYTGSTKIGTLHKELTLNLNEELINQDSTIHIKGLPAGIYAVGIKGKDLLNKPYKILTSTSLFGQIQKFGNQFDLQVLDVNSGFPATNTDIVFYKFEDSHFQYVHNAVTDQKGFVHYQKERDQVLYYRIINPENPGGYVFRISKSYSRPIQTCESTTQLITDRYIYRPGETVYFKGYNWNATRDNLTANENTKHEIILKDANQKEISKIYRISNTFGTFSGSFVIPNDAMNGTYCIETQNNYSYIKVAEYKRPEFEIRFESPKQHYRDGDTICILGKVVSYSGVNLTDEPVHYSINGIGEVRHFLKKIVTDGTTITNSSGEFEIKFVAPHIMSKNVSPRIRRYYNITANLTDSKGETQESRTIITVYGDTAKPMLEIPKIIDKTLPAVFGIDLSDYPPNEPQEIHYRLEKLVEQTVPNAKIDSTVEKKVAEGKKVMQQHDSITLQLQKMPSGAYLFTAECKGIKEQRVFLLYSSQDKRPPIATYNWMIEEKTVCHNGEKARILFGSSLENVCVHYQVFSNNQNVSNKQIILNNEIKSIEIPYLKEYANEITLYIYCIKNKRYIQHIIPLKRKRELPKLKIETTVFRDKLTPGKQEEWQLKITNHGKAAIAEVLAMMYDASLDNLASYHFQIEPQLLDPLSIPIFDKPTWRFERQSIETYGKREKYTNPYTSAYTFNRLNLYTPPRNRNLLYMTSSSDPEYEEDIVYSMSFYDADMGSSMETEEKLTAVPSLSEPVQLRKNLQPTAFFYPQLQTDSTGMVNIRFTVPDALTRWRFIALATTQDMGAAKIERYITTSKPLMVRPNMPRFMRSGDQAEIRTIVSNLSDSLQQGTVSFELLIPGTDEVVVSRETPFKIAAKQNGNACFQFKVPEQYHLLVCRIIAKGTDFNDGEQHYIPILSNEVMVNITQPIFLNTEGKHTFSLKEKSADSRNYRLTLEMTANPIWYVVQALPKLQQPAHENATDIIAAYYVNAIASCIANANPAIINAILQWKKDNSQDVVSPLYKNPELKSILAEATPWAIEAQNETERMQSLSELFDENRLEYLQKEALKKLTELQTTEGGWCWFKNMPANTFITLNILTAMQRVTLYAQKQSNEQEKRMQFKAIQYLDKEVIKEYKKNSKHISYEQILYLYVRSLYNDIPLGDALEAHKHLMQLAIRQWGRSSFYEKALLATIFQRHGFKEQAQKVIESLRQYAIVTPEYGMYWPNNQNIIFYNSAIQTHTAILEAFEEINGHTLEIDQMQQWLLRQKEVQNWGAIPSTVDAIHALLLGGNSTLTAKDVVNIKIGTHSLSTANTNNTPGYLKVSYSANEISPHMLKAEVEKHNSSPSWGGIYLQKFQKLETIKAQKTILTIDKKLYIENINANGKKELISTNGRTLKIGEKIIVRLNLSLTQDMQYLHLKDLRAACLEPTEQLSGYEYKNGISYYKEVKDACTNFFFDFLPRGNYVIEYSALINQSGIYQDGIASMQSIYAPIYNTYSNSNTIIVNE